MDRRRFLRQFLTICDAVTLTASLFAAYWLCAHVFHRELEPMAEYAWMLWAIGTAWTVSFRAFHLYEHSAFESANIIVSRMFPAHALASLMLLSTMYLTKSGEISRVLIQTFIGVSFVALLLQKTAVSLSMERICKRNSPQLRRIVVVCNEAQVSAYPRVLKAHPLWPGKLIGLVVPKTFSDPVASYHGELPVLGQSTDLSKILESHVVDEIVVVQPFERSETERIAQWCMQRGLIFRNLIELPRCKNRSYQPQDLGKGAYFLSLEPTSQHVPSLLFKRLLDIAGSFVGLLLLLPVYFLFGRRLRRETSATVFFAQTRVGKNGRRFSLYKLRTMYADAGQRLNELARFNEMRGPIFKMKNDPRVTPTGRVLRERHLDELPQFWNVLKGDMSLVGTRPPTTSEFEVYDDHHYRRLSIKPGLTGLWQVKGNGKVTDFEDVVKLDCEYIDNWSIWLDCKIIAKTVIKMISRTGW